MLEQASTLSTMIVGVHRTDDPDELVRITEYSPGFDPAKFAAHEAFFVDEVGSWVRSRFGVDLPPERAAGCGVPASAGLALGLRHPDRFGSFWAADSPRMVAWAFGR